MSCNSSCEYIMRSTCSRYNKFAQNLVLSGVGKPSSLLGNVGDMYIDIINNTVYGPKSCYGWNNVTDSTCNSNTSIQCPVTLAFSSGAKQILPIASQALPLIYYPAIIGACDINQDTEISDYNSI